MNARGPVIIIAGQTHIIGQTTLHVRAMELRQQAGCGRILDRWSPQYILNEDALRLHVEAHDGGEPLIVVSPLLPPWGVPPVWLDVGVPPNGEVPDWGTPRWLADLADLTYDLGDDRSSGDFQDDLFDYWARGAWNEGEEPW